MKALGIRKLNVYSLTSLLYSLAEQYTPVATVRGSDVVLLLRNLMLTYP